MPPYFSPRLSTPHQSNTQTAQTPSPNYFGFQGSDASGFMTDAPQHTKSNWSPPSSAVRSTAAASPSVVPADQNPEYDAFRQHSGGKAFNLGSLGNFNMSAPPARSSEGRAQSKTSVAKDGAQTIPDVKSATLPQPRTGRDSLDPASAEMSQSPKRMLSPGSLTYPETRRASPASMATSEPGQRLRREASPERQPRLKLPLDKSISDGYSMPKHRAETLPASNDNESSVMVTAQHIVNLIDSNEDSVLLLDLRVSTQYAQSHVHGALNLCIPTTLLKRPSFNVEKLAETFKEEAQRNKFESWRSSKYIVVYDNSSAQLKDAAICLNTIKKFKTEGYEGTLYIIKGGYMEFAKRFSSYVGAGREAHEDSSATYGEDGEGPKVAPVIGGCPMPSTDKPANPFFGNIRQNMDLIGGVGQMPIQHPARATQSTEERGFPEWLKQASAAKDQGKKVSKRFEQIERREKKRMEDALSGQVTFDSSPKQSKQDPRPVDEGVQIAGIEKGTKNRYNNIWPFEHSRVKLQGIPNHGCDYFNASHIQAAWSNKRYISTQAPIPATFNDFWNIVWQQDVRVLVMLTAEKEGAQVKAHNYWNERQYGPLRLELLSEKRASLDPVRIYRSKHRPSGPRRSSTSASNVPLATTESKEEKMDAHGEQPYVTVRKLTLSHENFPFERMREITQLQYSHWPDFGAPAHPAHLLGLVEQTDAVVRVTDKIHSGEPMPPNHRPILVHCSAGCGRTGTFCTVDSVIDMLKRQRLSRLERDPTPMEIDQKTPSRRKSSTQQEDYWSNADNPAVPESGGGPEGSWISREDQDLVEKTVEDFRHQRLSMVQSLRQYVLCYESVMEWIVEQEQGPGGPS